MGFYDNLSLHEYSLSHFPGLIVLEITEKHTLSIGRFFVLLFQEYSICSFKKRMDMPVASP